MLVHAGICQLANYPACAHFLSTMKALCNPGVWLLSLEMFSYASFLCLPIPGFLEGLTRTVVAAGLGWGILEEEIDHTSASWWGAGETATQWPNSDSLCLEMVHQKPWAVDCLALNPCPPRGHWEEKQPLNTCSDTIVCLFLQVSRMCLWANEWMYVCIYFIFNECMQCNVFEYIWWIVYTVRKIELAAPGRRLTQFTAVKKKCEEVQQLTHSYIIYTQKKIYNVYWWGKCITTMVGFEK